MSLQEFYHWHESVRQAFGFLGYWQVLGLALYSYGAWNSNTPGIPPIPDDYSGGTTYAFKWFADANAYTAGTPGGTIRYYFDTSPNSAWTSSWLK